MDGQKWVVLRKLEDQSWISAWPSRRTMVRMFATRGEAERAMRGLIEGGLDESLYRVAQVGEILENWTW
jgi:hypothetical protein